MATKKKTTTRSKEYGTVRTYIAFAEDTPGSLVDIGAYDITNLLSESNYYHDTDKKDLMELIAEESDNGRGQILYEVTFKPVMKASPLRRTFEDL